jgi:hypothetical protein
MKQSEINKIRMNAIINYIDRFSVALCLRRDALADLCSGELAEEFDNNRGCKSKILPIIEIFIVKNVADQFRYDIKDVFR